MSKIWSFMIVLSLVVAFFSHSLDNVVNIISKSCSKTLENSLMLMGLTCFWMGIFNILKNTKIVSRISNIMKPFICKLFNKEELNEEITNNMSLNITSNMLGVGNAATAYGIKTAEEMSKVSKRKNVVSNNLATFIVLNTASVQLIPTSIISLLMLYEASNPTGAIIPIWISSFVSLAVGLVVIKVLNRVDKCY